MREAAGKKSIDSFLQALSRWNIAYSHMIGCAYQRKTLLFWLCLRALILCFIETAFVNVSWFGFQRPLFKIGREKEYEDDRNIERTLQSVLL